MWFVCVFGVYCSVLGCFLLFFWGWVFCVCFVVFVVLFCFFFSLMELLKQLFILKLQSKKKHLSFLLLCTFGRHLATLIFRVSSVTDLTDFLSYWSSSIFFQ